MATHSLRENVGASDLVNILIRFSFETQSNCYSFQMNSAITKNGEKRKFLNKFTKVFKVFISNVEDIRSYVIALTDIEGDQN